MDIHEEFLLKTFGIANRIQQYFLCNITKPIGDYRFLCIFSKDFIVSGCDFT